ncbi:MAG: DNA recombination protein RmuC [Tannerella sp.]|uniref:DNA recombination protein RmuC n=1 Tax=Tannerella sp. TaxID=2382127 RepID=UPI003FA262B7
MITILIILLIVLVLINVYLTLKKGENVRDEELGERLIKMDTDLSRMDPLIRDEFGRSREENLRAAKENRAEQRLSLKSFEDSFMRHVKDFNSFQKEKFEALTARQEMIKQEVEGKLKEIRDTVEGKLNSIREDNSRKLEEMRRTVDEKLQETVEKRFNESFKLISERLEEVHKGLGEMQSLASGVGDLKKVLTNVKTRGNLGEIQLGVILEQILSPEQYEQNAIVKEGSQERVEYVIKLPNRNDEEKSLLLPIDSKFPNEDYQRLIEAYERATDLNPKELETIGKQFEASIKKNAKSIRDKYIRPPLTTDFAIMFVPTEGLYAEILRRTGLFECLQREFKITVVGPTNLVAFLSSLQMGFKTLAIEKRSSEVWEILGAVKTEFGRFGTILEKTKKKLQEATNVIDRAGVRSRAIERKLKEVQALPQEESVAVLGEAIETEEEEK